MIDKSIIDAAQRLHVHHSLDASHEHDCFIVAREYLRLLDSVKALIDRGYIDKPTQRFIVPKEFIDALTLTQTYEKT